MTVLGDRNGGVTEEEAEREIDKLQAATDSASEHVRNLYITFLLFGLYLATAIGATTHEQLLRSAPVNLPIVNVELPLFGFYWIAPALFVLLHFNLLIQFALLASKLHRLDQTIERNVKPASARAARRDLLNPFPFSHVLIGRHHRRILRFFLGVMVLVTVIFLPVTLLLFAQTQFLAYHSLATTMAHRVLVIIDLLLILLLWPRIRYPGDDFSAKRGRWLWHRTRMLAGATIVVVFSLVIAVIPGEFLAGWIEAGRGRAPFNLFVRDATLVTAWPTNEQIEHFGDDDAWQSFGESISVARRDLSYGRFSGTNFTRADLSEANLSGADLFDAKLQGADLRDANLQGADLSEASLHGASLQGADLQSADLQSADLQGANLEGANLQEAILFEADLQGADLSDTNLQGADLFKADLRGADLQGADLRGALLSEANLQGADLRRANLWQVQLTKEVGFWNLADLRQIDIDALIAETKEGIVDEETQDKFVEHPNFTDGWRSKPNVMLGLDTQMAKDLGWSKPMEEKVYDKLLGEFLVNLACGEQAAPEIAEGIVRRARSAKDRSLSWVLAVRLTEATCPQAASLPENMRSALKRLAANTRFRQRDF